MAKSEKPNAKFDHVFVIFRANGISVPIESSVSVTQVVWTEEAARIEVERLNQINASKNAHYFYQLGRLHRRAASSEPEA